jgi:hypothetical protein
VPMAWRAMSSGGSYREAVFDLAVLRRDEAERHPASRGLHSCSFQLNLRAMYGIGGARRDCVARVKGGLGGVYGV